MNEVLGKKIDKEAVKLAHDWQEQDSTWIANKLKELGYVNKNGEEINTGGATYFMRTNRLRFKNAKLAKRSVKPKRRASGEPRAPYGSKKKLREEGEPGMQRMIIQADHGPATLIHKIEDILTSSIKQSLKIELITLLAKQS